LVRERELDVVETHEVGDQLLVQILLRIDLDELLE